MNEDPNAVKKEEVPAAVIPPVNPTGTDEDIEARIAKLEEEKANYKLAFLKEKSKNKSENFNGDEETEDEKIARIVSEKLAETKIAQIDSEKEALLKQVLKENKELKLAQLNKPTTTPTSMGSHSEGIAVTDTTITPEQMAAFKAKGWTDKDIERYKKNLSRYSK